ncbi:MAG: DUF2971 domain-containing protein [Chlorobi bacterium]|nr:DUF2971 domain-containing protein [Chlorobiota bacterium]
MNYREEIPNILYKYRDYSNKYNKRTLFDFEIFLASTSMFNDPYEGAIPFEYEPEDLTEDNIFLKLREVATQKYPDWSEDQIRKHCYEAQKRDLLNNDVHIAEQNELNRKKINRTFGILSLTGNPLNYLMWSHYGNKHTGYCIGFDKCILNDIVQGVLSPVTYDLRIPKLRLFESIGNFHKKQLATKYKIWDYEEEYRIVKGDASKQVIKYPKEMIKRVYLGCKMKYPNKTKIISFIKSNDIECEVFQLTLDNQVFKLNSQRIN